ncbi:MAG: hypothetical protein M0D57_15285 [Sphingobacteriales bacterium JAD_PAG50586_3]|nr:MAG: hypothetical protein M0D57_15285 [Sphingobacteriales bacterium JAD_PAG50586_3]
MKKLLLFIPVLTLAIFYSACKKDSPGPQQIPLQPGNYEIYSYFLNQAVPTQTFSVKADEQTTITTTAGAEVTFWPNSFKMANNTIVSGYVDISLKEIYTKKDMILNNATTTSGGNILVSKGEMYLLVTQNGQELFPTQQYKVKLPSSGIQNYIPVFTGTVTNPNPNNTAINYLNWIQDTTNFYKYVVNGDTSYIGYPDDFNWINCDYFYNNTDPKDSISAVLPSSFDETNTKVFISIDSEEAVGNVFNIHPGSNKYRFNSIPIGTNVHMTSFSVSNGKLYFGLGAGTVGTGGTTLNLVPQEVDPATIENLLNNLP